MSALSDYLAKKREQREADGTSPEQLLTSIVQSSKKHKDVTESTGGRIKSAIGSASYFMKQFAQELATSYTVEQKFALAEAALGRKQFKITDDRLARMVKMIASIDKHLLKAEQRNAKLDKRMHDRDMRERLAGAFTKKARYNRSASGSSLFGDALEDALDYDVEKDRGRRGRGGRGGRGARGGRGIRGFFTRQLSRFGLNGGGRSLWSRAGGLWRSAKNAGASLFGRNAGKAATVAGSALALGLGAKDVYDISQDEQEKDKSKAVAGSVSGTAGSLAGMQAGSAIGAAAGTALAPGIGTAIGGVGGGVIGGIAGSKAGQYVGTKAVEGGRWVGDKAGIDTMDKLMLPVNALMAIWSKDQREILHGRVMGQIVPQFKDTVKSMAETSQETGKNLALFVTNFGKKLDDWGRGIVDGISKAWEWIKNAPANIKQGVKNIAGRTVGVADSASRSVGQVYDDLQRKFNVAVGNTQSVAGAPKALGKQDALAMSKSSYAEALATRESAGNYGVKNSLGYLGAFQMGNGALEATGYKKNGQWTGKDGVTSEASYLASKDAQDKAMKALSAQNWKTMNAKPLKMGPDGKPIYAKDMIGQKINGLTITESGLLGAAHLGGAGSVTDFLRSGGKNVAVDGNGVPLTNYMTTMGNKDVSDITGMPYQDRKTGAYMFMGNENTYIPVGRGKKTAVFSNLTGNNDVNAKVSGLAPNIVPQATAPTVIAKKDVVVQAPKPSLELKQEPIRALERKPTYVEPEREKIKVEKIQRENKQTPVMGLPTLSSVPYQIDDMGLMLINAGFI